MSTITARVTTDATAIPALRHRDTVIVFPADQDDFVTKYEANNDHLVTNTVPEFNAIGDQINLIADQMNTVAGEVNTNATTATTQAGIATTQAGISTAQAVISTTKADESSASATASQLKAWIAEAEAMTAEAYAITPLNTLVDEYTSDGDGTFTVVSTANYSALHWAATINDANIVHKNADETINDIKTFTSSPIVPTPTTALQASTKGYVDNKPSGFKNYIINGRKTINQSGLTSTDNSYNQDQWYKSGLNWYQPIEGDNNLISGNTYTLSWVGVATASYYVGSESSAVIAAVGTWTAIANGGSLTLTIVAGQHLWIKFASDATGSTFNFVQFEDGEVATPFEHRHPLAELSLCQWFFRYFKTVSINQASFGMVTGGGFRSVSPSLSISMRIAPTISYSVPLTATQFDLATGTSVLAVPVTVGLDIVSKYVGFNTTNITGSGFPAAVRINETAFVYLSSQI